MQRRLGQALARTASQGRPRGPRAAGFLTGSTAFRCTCLRRDAQIQARQERWAKGTLGLRGSSAGWVPAAVGAVGPLGARNGTPRPSQGAPLLAGGGSPWGTGSIPGDWSRLGQGSGDCFARPRVFSQALLDQETAPEHPDCARSLLDPSFPPQPNSLSFLCCRHHGRLSLPSAQTCPRIWFCTCSSCCPACL